jgi:hypothetical protein
MAIGRGIVNSASVSKDISSESSSGEQTFRIEKLKMAL